MPLLNVPTVPPADWYGDHGAGLGLVCFCICDCCPIHSLNCQPVGRLCVRLVICTWYLRRVGIRRNPMDVGVAKPTVKLGAGNSCPGWPQLPLHGGQERKSRNHSALGAPRSPPRGGAWLLGGSLPTVALRGFQPFLPSKGLRFGEPFASRLCLQCQGPACFTESPCALLPGAEFLLQGPKFCVLPSDAAEGQGNNVL